MAYLDKIQVGGTTYDIQDSNLKSAIPTIAGAIPYEGGIIALNQDATADTTKLYYVNLPGNAHDGQIMFYDSTAWKYGRFINNLVNSVGAKTILSDFDFENKGIEAVSGNSSASTQRAKTTDYIDPIIRTISAKDGYEVALFAYDNDNVYQGLWNGTSFVKASPIIYYVHLTIPNYTYNYLCVCRKKDNSQISVAEAKSNITFIVSNYVIESDIISEYKQTVDFEYGGLYQTTGALVDNTIRARSKLTTIDENESDRKLSFDIVIPGDFVFQWIVFYKDGIYVSNSTSGYTNKHGEYSIDGWNQFRLVFRKSDNSEITFTELSNIKLTINGLSRTKYIFNSINDRIENLNIPYKKDWYYGKKYAALGDSITYGFIPRNYTGYPGQLNSYAKLTALKLGMNFANYGINESTLAYSEHDPMSRRYQNLPDDADLITVMGGTNDIRNEIPVGTFSDTTDSTFYGALHIVLGGLYKKYFIDQSTTKGEQTKIVVLTPIKLLDSSAESIGGTGTLANLQPYINAIKEVADYYSFPVLDFYNTSGINPHLNETIQGTVSPATGFYNPYITDGTHPTQEGAEIMANVLVGFLESLA